MSETSVVANSDNDDDDDDDLGLEDNFDSEDNNSEITKNCDLTKNEKILGKRGRENEEEIWIGFRWEGAGKAEFRVIEF